MIGMQIRRRRVAWRIGGTLACAAATLVLAAPAQADVFNGRIAFSSVRTDPQAKEFDIFSMNSDGSDVRRLTTNPQTDRQPDWTPHGTDIAYSIDKPNSAANFEVARMTAAGTKHLRLTETPDGQASTQPSWRHDGRGILFRRSGPGRVSTIWQMGLFGERPALRFMPPHAPLYQSFSPDMTRIAYAGITSPTGDTDRGIFTIDARDGSDRTLFDVPEAYDSAPAWSPDGTKVAFESNADVAGANPERDMEIWIMQADGSQPTQLTGNTAHDEGPAWSPDGRLLAYTSGPDERHGDIHVIPAGGSDARRLTSYANADESPDWQAIPAPRTDARCGGLGRPGRGVSDMRTAGRDLACATARTLVRRWLAAERPRRVGGYTATVTDFGGLRRVVLRRTDGERRRLVAFLYRRGSTR